MDIEHLYKIYIKYRFISTDSRKCEKNALFFALKGENFDGNNYASKALENGCSFAVVDKKEVICDDRYILVNDVLQTLQTLANYHRKKLKLPILAITGTNGKTTTKELISAVLKKKFNVINTIGNLNNHIGVPLTLLSMDEKTEIGIVEMGANHQGEIKLLSHIAEPNYGIITNIGKAHLEGFGSFENIISTKTELYQFISENKGLIFFNGNNKILKEKINLLPIKNISYGINNDDVVAINTYSSKFLSIDIRINNKTKKINTNLVGDYNVENVLAAVCIANYFKVDLDEMIDAIENYKPTNNRSQFVETKQNNLILDAYNANPTSVDAALQNFYSQNLMNKCIILGDMLELGNESLNEHQVIFNKIEKMNFSMKIVVGDIYSKINPGKDILQFYNVESLIDWLKINKIVNSNVLIKGSRGIKLERIVEFL